MLKYCNGNTDILYACTFAEILEILEFVTNRESDETLLKAYEASYSALKGISLQDFKKSAQANSASLWNSNQTTEQIERKIEHYIDDFNWEVV